MRKTGAETFRFNGVPQSHTLLGFWQWASSGLLSNTLRGQLAEYVVALALGIEGAVRTEWAAYDLAYGGLTIEVKSSAYLQAWFQKAPSKITFRIPPTHAWSAETNETAKERRRQAHLYIFCLLGEQCRERVDPLELEQWTFYLLATSTLDARCGAAKKITLAQLLKLQPTTVDFAHLRRAVDTVREGMLAGGAAAAQ